MSDGLTRYRQEPPYHAPMEEDPTHGEWVRADDAEARIKKLESGAIDQALPDAPIDENTEIVWVNGRAFINQAKHEQVVDRHVARIKELEAERDTCVAQWRKLDDRIAELEAEVEWAKGKARMYQHAMRNYHATKVELEARLRACAEASK